MRRFRIIIAALMLAASILFLTAGPQVLPMCGIAEQSQIIPSAISACTATTVFWIVVTLLFGRLYCATVCPVGALQDAAVWLRKKKDPKMTFRYKEGNQWRYRILLVYAVSLAIGVLAVGYVIEPWNMMRNAASAVRPEDTATTWSSIRVSAGVGIGVGMASLCVILAWAWRCGRAFCSEVCPIGAALGCVHQQTLMHIAIDPDKCISCMKCEDVCSSRCIKVTERLVDNSRCVRCFDCLEVCPNAAIRFQQNKDRHRQTPLMQKG